MSQDTIPNDNPSTSPLPAHTGNAHAPGPVDRCPPTSAVDLFLGGVREGLDVGAMTSTARQKFVQSLVDAEVDARAKVLSEAYPAFTALKSTIKGVKPIPTAFDADTLQPVGPGTLTKDQVDKLKKANEQLNKGEAALKKALNSPFDFNDLKKWIASQKNGGQDKKDTSSDDS